MLVTSITGAVAVTAPEGPEVSRQEATRLLKAYMAASPFGHDALAKGLNDLNTASTSAITSVYTKAVEDAAVELDENLYRVRVTMANVGINKENTGNPQLLGVENSENSNCGFKFYDTKANVTIWRFNIASDGKYTIACNVGQYIGYRESAYLPGNEKEVDLCPTTDKDCIYEFSVAYAENGEGVTFDIGGKYLAMDENGKFSFVDEVNDYAVWKLTRAYDESLDLPVFSTDANPVYYTMNNQAKGLLCVEKTWLNCKPLNDYSYWYFVDAGEKIGTFRLKNKKDSYGVKYTTANGRLRPEKGYESNSMLFFMLEGNEANGWSVSLHPTDHLTTYGYGTKHAMMYDAANDWVVGSVPNYNLNNLGLYTWVMEPVDTEGEAVEQFVNRKAELTQLYTDYAKYMPWCQAYLKNVLNDLSNFDISKYASANKAVEALETFATKTADSFFAKLNKEARGYNVKISNVRRLLHSNVANLGHYLTTVGEGDALTVNTTNELERNSGYWNIEGVEGNEKAFRLRNQNGVYLCAVSNGATVATTTNAEEAGLYSLLPYGGYIRIANADLQGAGLNVDTNGSALVGYDYKDGGSTWAFESVAIIPHVEGMPKLSDNTNKYIYVIRSATDPNDYLEFDADGIGLIHIQKSSLSYCYFVPANDGSDGIQIVCEEKGTRLCYSPNSNYYYSRISGWNTNPYFNLYLTPNGTVPEGMKDEGKNCFAISYEYPAKNATCISKKSNDSTHPQYISLGMAEDWQNTGWIFEEAETINHEEIFAIRRSSLLAEMESYQKALPWAQDMLSEACETIANAKMTDYAPTTPDAVNGLQAYFYGVITRVEEELEVEPDGAWVSIMNVRRLGNAESGAFLTAKNGYLNTSGKLTSAGKWQMKYHSNGRYNMVNADGLYMGELCDRVTVTADEAAAGKYSLKLLNGYVCLVDRNDENNRSLNVDQSQGDACVYSPADAGSRWIFALTTTTGIEEELAASAHADDVYYTPAGVKVAPENLTPGVYLRVRGTKTTKVLVK